MGRRGSRAQVTRKSNEFDLARLNARLYPPNSGSVAYAWDLAAIRNARDQQLAGRFYEPARLSESMRTDDALFVAKQNRLAPQRCIGVCLEPGAAGAKAKKIATEAAEVFGQDGVSTPIDVLADIHACLVDHGVAFGALTWTPRRDGARIDVRLDYWPIEFVWWDTLLRCYMTHTDNAVIVPICHGDGRWVVFAKNAHEPFKHDACILPGSLIWARHAFAARDWSKGSTQHGNAKVVGELPPGLALQNKDGGPTSEALAMLALLQAIASVDTPVGIKPSGSKLDYIVNTSTAWQVWSELMANAEKAAARIYLGTDGTMGSQGGAPGVDISALFGVATTKVQGDLGCLSRGINTGMIGPWTAINIGDSVLAPTHCYDLPDPDADAERKSYAERCEAFHTEIKRRRDNGFDVVQLEINELAERYAVDAPTLPQEAKRAPTIALAPTDIARVVKTNEARASAGLPPLTLPDGTLDPDGLLTVEEFSEKKKLAQQAASPAPQSNVASPTVPGQSSDQGSGTA